jgi:hypothetical protein
VLTALLNRNVPWDKYNIVNNSWEHKEPPYQKSLPTVSETILAEVNCLPQIGNGLNVLIGLGPLWDSCITIY